jgi:hypothetical protein
MTGILIALIIILIIGFSWLTTCGIIYLISLCFGFTFSWGIATGIWLIITLIKGAFNLSIKSHN